MKTKKAPKSVLLKLLAYLPIMFIFVPYFLILLLDTWQVRWFFGLSFFVFGPLIPLCVALNPNIKMTNFNPKELPKNRYILRHLGIFFRLIIIACCIGTMFQTVQYVRSSFQLVVNNWQMEHVTGVMKKFTGTYPGAIVFRDIYLEGSNDKLQLIYPFGKRPHSGLRYEFLVLPGTNIVVDLKEITSVSPPKVPVDDEKAEHRI